MQKRFTTRQIAQIALMAALVFVGTNLRIKIPVGGDGTMLHFGNVFCMLSGVLFGPLAGGLASGIGSALFDITSEYASEAWITFINKFALGFMAGFAMRRFPAVRSLRMRTVLACACGGMTYCVLYVLKNIVDSHYVKGLAWQAVWPIVSVKAAVTLTNAMIAVAACTLISLALRPALERTGILPKSAQ